MAVITESELRKRLKGKNLKDEKVFKVPKGSIITPSAKGFLNEYSIQLEFVDETKEEEQDAHVREWKPPVRKQPKAKKSPLKYQLLHGGYIDEKPEHMTALYGNVLVYKDHKRIQFRGKLDSLESKILEAQMQASTLGMEKMAEDLQEVLDFIRNLVRCEVLGEEVEQVQLLNMNDVELREMSHHPKKYFGSGHFFPDYRMGEGIVILNGLRSLTRETELLAYQAFKLENGEAERGDIILALNRLSSLFWIMMFKYKTGYYNAKN
ncbi:ethanolamine utilization cobalamin adenosyltransferase [Pontibacillus litoralis]|uniref:Ethanolamine corrinoid cobalamin adenosyltransferase n=1 Tax=Pontibacillus litoralis JSM 072002 TaxID=1385512 RepID=A0A0A5G0D5_9BACI|nr:ethanolamine utilization cobalamin adenosyltransferase [Pontibacillus litoralis]KGX84510.1 ethanolamine corrinoid cobalamin adenosyltransferase [Pontibacillus litoralis JSM 072002]